MTEPAGVTHSRKCYAFVCAGCRLLALSWRKQTISCSPACRVRIHRRPELIADLKDSAKHLHVTVASILQGAAIDAVRPDLGNQIVAGTLTLSQAQTHVVPEVLRLFANARAERHERAASPEVAA